MIIKALYYNQYCRHRHMAAALSFAGLPGMIQKYIKMRCVMTEYKMVLPVLAAFIVSVVLGPIIIPYLR